MNARGAPDAGMMSVAVQRFGLDTITLAGPLESKLAAMRDAGFRQVMINARDLASYPAGVDAAIDCVRNSGLRTTGFQVLRDFEGLSGHLHDYKVDIAKSMLKMCEALGSDVLLVCSSTSRHAESDPALLARDLCKLATLALPLGIRIAYEALSWGRFVNDYAASWRIVEEADWPNLGLAIDSFHVLAARSEFDALQEIDPGKLFLVQLSDFLWQYTPTFEDRKNTARTFRVFPGEGVHTERLVELTRTLHRIGYQGDYSFEVFNDDYQQLPTHVVCERGLRSAHWLSQQVLGLPAPLPAWTRGEIG